MIISEAHMVPFLVLGALALLAGFILWIVRRVNRDQERRRRMFMEYGFRSVPERSADLAERMKILHHHWSGHHSVDKVKLKSEWGYELFLFDLRDSSRNSARLDQDQAVMVSPELKLPRFTMFPKVEGTGLVATLVNRAMTWAASKFAVQITFPEVPGFDARYAVWGNDEAAVRSCFSHSRLERMAEAREWLVEGSDDGLLFSRMSCRQTRRTDVEKLQDILQNAKILFDIFKE
jgi:hypothetical protein